MREAEREKNGQLGEVCHPLKRAKRPLKGWRHCWHRGGTEKRHGDRRRGVRVAQSGSACPGLRVVQEFYKFRVRRLCEPCECLGHTGDSTRQSDSVEKRSKCSSIPHRVSPGCPVTSSCFRVSKGNRGADRRPKS